MVKLATGEIYPNEEEKEKEKAGKKAPREEMKETRDAAWGIALGGVGGS